MAAQNPALPLLEAAPHLATARESPGGSAAAPLIKPCSSTHVQLYYRHISRQGAAERCRGRMLAGVGMGTRPLPTRCESPRFIRHGPRHLPGMALAAVYDRVTSALYHSLLQALGMPKPPSERKAGCGGTGRPFEGTVPSSGIPPHQTRQSMVVQQGSQLRLLASPAGFVAHQGNTMALSDICNSFCSALPEELGISAQLLPCYQGCGSSFQLQLITVQSKEPAAMVS